jgi:hypothetical protein
VYLNNWGKSDLFCLSCKQCCTINNAATIASFGASIIPIAIIYLLIFVSGSFSPPEYSKAIFAICAIPAAMVLRAFATEKFARLVSDKAVPGTGRR